MNIEKKLKKLVSKKKRRFRKDGFDLDLTYITDNIIAMGFPSEKMEGVYRNHQTEVIRFLEHYHPGKYKVYNLCSERMYDPILFKNSFKAFPFQDHNAPPFTMIEAFCNDVCEFFETGGDVANTDRLAAIHCKAGKGRTGVMISCLLVHMGLWSNADDALEFYGAMRTENAKGVTIPSQIRYVKYYGKMLNEKLEYSPAPKVLNNIILSSLPLTDRKYPSIRLYVSNHDGLLFSVLQDKKKGQDSIEFPLENLVLKGDVKCEFIHVGSGKEKLLHFWFNTFFIDSPRLTLTKLEIDKINKDKQHKMFKEDISITLDFVEDSVVSERKTTEPHITERIANTEDEEDLSDEEDTDEWGDDKNEGKSGDEEPVKSSDEQPQPPSGAVEEN